MKPLLVAFCLLCALSPVQAASWQIDKALVRAVEAGDLAQVRKLIAQGADVNAVNDYGQTALARAARRGNYDAVKLLLDGGANANSASRGGGPLVVAAGGDYGDKSVALCRLLLARGADPNGQPDRTPLVAALGGLAGERQKLLHPPGPAGRPEAVQAMLKKSTETMLAILRLLIRSGADVNHEYRLGHLNDGTTPLGAAARAGSVEAMTLLLASGARDSPDYELGMAASSGSAPAVAFLLSRGANPNAWRSAFSHNTALLEAAEADAPDCIRLLVNAGADVNAQGGQGYTALTREMSRLKPSVAVVKLLLAHGADPNLATEDGTTPLHLAEEAKEPGLITWLKSAGARESP